MKPFFFTKAQEISSTNDMGMRHFALVEIYLPKEEMFEDFFGLFPDFPIPVYQWI